MTRHPEDWQSSAERRGVEWHRVGQRVILIAVLLAVAILLVVGTQNFDERTRVHFLLWSWEVPLLIFFLICVGLGILADEVFRLFFRLRPRRASAQSPAKSGSRPSSSS
jgi:uncharacterized integral membrane protein